MLTKESHIKCPQKSIWYGIWLLQSDENKYHFQLVLWDPTCIKTWFSVKVSFKFLAFSLPRFCIYCIYMHILYYFITSGMVSEYLVQVFSFHWRVINYWVNYYCTTSSNKAWTQVMHSFKSCPRCVRDLRWWKSLTMVRAVDAALLLSLSNHSAKPLHYHQLKWVYEYEGC